MKIHECFLHCTNGERCGRQTIGEMVGATGKKALWSPRQNVRFDVIVVHYMSAVNHFPDSPYDLECVIPLFCEYGVSSHYLIDRRGEVFHLVPDECKAWHCGGSVMPDPDGRCDVNEFSVGIELLATDQSGFTPEQYRSLGAISHKIELREDRIMRYVGHDQIAGERAVSLGLRCDLKTDPGPLFLWGRFLDELERRRENP